MDREEFKERFIKARRAAIAADFSRLNDMQREAVLTTEGPLLLLAGAGSGKTTVLINRIVNLIRYGRGSDCDYVPDWAEEADLEAVESGRAGADLLGVEPCEPWRILAITFTNKAADELKARLLTALGEESQDIWAMTFHSCCVRILRRHIDLLGYDKSFTIYDSSDSQAVMKRVTKELELDEKMFPPKLILSVISRAKDEMQSAEDFAAAAEKSFDSKQRHYARCYVEYEKRLKAANAVDFDDLIFLTVRLLSENREVREYYQRFFRYVLVDEYQDTSILQYKLVSLLAGGYNNLCVVGDDDQSIYKFRGATIENILSFEKSYPGARTIKLEQNYRSTAHILGAANAVIRNNLGRKGKELWTNAGDGDKPKLYVAVNEDDEAQFVANRILEAVSGGMNFRDCAVLYRMNAQSNRLEYAFKRQGIPYRVVGGMRFFDRAEIKDITSYLAAIHNPEDDLRLLRIINNPPRGIGAATIETVRSIASVEAKSISAVIANADRYPELKAPAKKLLKFSALLDELRESAGSMPLDDFYDELLNKSGYLESLGTNDEALARIDNLKELKSNIIAYMEGAETPTLAGFLDEIALYTDLDGVENGDNNVIMMTMHAAKGLEFPYVFIVGMEDGIFPSLRSIGDSEEMEEERRLCYVALTRAKEKLFLIAAKQRMIFGKTSANMISRFVDEIPEEHIEKPENTRSRRYSAWDEAEEEPSYSWQRRERYTPDEGAYSRQRRDGRADDSSGYGGWSARKTEVRQYKKPVEAPKKTVEAPKAPALMAIDVGDRVKHKAFGEGTVLAVTPMPGDALISVQFGDKERKLMLKTAGSFMTKI